MFNVDLKINLKNFEALQKLQKDIRKNLVETGLDIPILKCLPQLKSELKIFLNNSDKVPVPNGNKSLGLTDVSSSLMPKADADLIKYITGLDINKLRTTADYTASIDSNAVIVNDNRVRFRIPISDYQSFDETLQNAVKFFNNAIFIIADGSEVKYFLNPGVDLTRFVKIVCSTDVGDTERSRNKYKNYRDGNNMPRQSTSDIGRFAEYSLKQNFVKTITDPNSGFIDLTNVINNIKSGDYDDALKVLSSVKAGNNQFNIAEKINNIKEKKDLTPDVQAYSNIISLINNLKIKKTIKETEVKYELFSDFDDSAASGSKFFDLVYNDINVWIIQNSMPWFQDFIKVANNILDKYR